MIESVSRRPALRDLRAGHTPLGLRNIAHFMRDPLGFLQTISDQGGDVADLRMLGRPWMLFTHPDDVAEVFSRKEEDLGRDDYSHLLERALGKGLLTSDGDLWRRQRKLSASAFTPKRIKGYARRMSTVTAAGLERWESGRTIDLHAEMSRLTMEVVADVLFGASVGIADVETVRHSLEAFNEYFAQSPEVLFRLPPWFPTSRNRRMNEAVEAIDRLVYSIIEQRRRAGDEDKGDLLSALLSARAEDGAGMDDKQLRDEVVTLFLAGHETTALALVHALELLARHPECEKRLVAELDGVLGTRLPSEEDVPRLVYAERVVKEAMRLYPPAWITGREAMRDQDFAGRRITKGTQLLVCQWLVHRDPRWFSDPEAFDPDRWMPEATAARPKFAYFPFGGGARICIGNHFAMMEAVLMLACVVQRFHVSLVPFERLEFAPSVTLRPKRGLRGSIAARAKVEPSIAANASARVEQAS